MDPRSHLLSQPDETLWPVLWVLPGAKDANCIPGGVREGKTMSKPGCTGWVEGKRPPREGEAVSLWGPEQVGAWGTKGHVGPGRGTPGEVALGSASIFRGFSQHRVGVVMQDADLTPQTHTGSVTIYLLHLPHYFYRVPGAELLA